MARRAEGGQANARRRSRGALALFFIAAGSNHFVMPGAYRQIVPPGLQREAKLIVEVSGVAEIAGGLAVLLPRARRAAGVYLIALLAAVFPANLYMAFSNLQVHGLPSWIAQPSQLQLWLRLPLQLVLIAWAHWVSAKP